MSPSWAPTPHALINNGQSHNARFASYTESAAKSLAMPPADLTAEHLFAHSDGELFGWLTHGMEGPDGKLVMPGFGDQLDEDQRWSLIDYIRAHNTGLGVTLQGLWPRAIKAPDASVTLDSKPVSRRPRLKGSRCRAGSGRTGRARSRSWNR